MRIPCALPFAFSSEYAVNPYEYWSRGLLAQKDERASFTKFKQLFVAKIVFGRARPITAPDRIHCCPRIGNPSGWRKFDREPNSRRENSDGWARRGSFVVRGRVRRAGRSRRLPGGLRPELSTIERTISSIVLRSRLRSSARHPSVLVWRACSRVRMLWPRETSRASRQADSPKSLREVVSCCASLRTDG